MKSFSFVTVLLLLLCLAFVPPVEAQRRKRTMPQTPLPVSAVRVRSVGIYTSSATTESSESVAILVLKAGGVASLIRPEKGGKTVSYAGTWVAAKGHVMVALTDREGRPFNEKIGFQRTGDILTATNYQPNRFLTDSPLVLSRAQGSVEMGFVTGIVVCRQPTLLPANAMVDISLVDVSRVNATAIVLSRQVIRKDVTPPLPFRLGYRKSVIASTHTYAVQARILSGRKLLFVSTRAYRVLTHNSPLTVEVIVDKVGRN